VLQQNPPVLGGFRLFGSQLPCICEVQTLIRFVFALIASNTLTGKVGSVKIEG
jgi:hypothetical protein